MTLISAFQVIQQPSGPHGIVLCADSQETVTQYDEHNNPYEVRVAVQKIEPLIKRDNLYIAIAGGGNAGLIDGYITKATRALEARPEIDTVIGARSILESELSRFYRDDVANCPDSEKEIKLFIAASCPQNREYALWVSNYQVLSKPKFPALIGWAHGVYLDTASRLNVSGMSLQQAVLASIYTLTIAKQTSNYIGGELSVAIINPGGIWMEEKKYIAEMESRLKLFEAKMNQVFLHCADTSVSPTALQKTIEQFGTEAIELHRGQILAHVSSMTLEELSNMNVPYPKFPLGSSVVYGMDGKFLGIEDPEHKVDADVYAKKAYDHFAAQGLVEYVLRRISAEKFSVSLSGRWNPDKKDTFLCELNRQEVMNVLSDAEPFKGKDILAFMNEDGSEFICYGPPMPSTPQTLEGRQ